MTKTLCTLLCALIGTSAQAVTVPLILEGNAPIVELEFTTPAGAPRKARFLVDTGGGGFILGSELMADVGAKPSGPEVKEEGQRMQPLEAVVARLGGMELDLSAAHTIGLRDSKWLNARNEAEGMIPGRVLRRYHVVFDYPARRFTLARPGELEPRGVKVETPISSSSGFPRIELAIGGQAYGFLLDTGASFTMISRTVLDRWAKDNPAWPKATGAVGYANMFGGSVENEALMLRIPEGSLGSLSVKAAAAVSRPEGTFEKWMSDMMTAPIIGALAGNVLRDLRVEIDYQNGFTYLERAGTSTDADLMTVGLVLAGRGGGLVVTGVSSSAPPDVKNGVHAGDRLIAVDDVSLAGKSLAAAAEALQGKAGERKRLTLERDGRSTTVTVSVKELL